ncbi:hypothetical protein AAYR32_08160 [Streptococcus agalactiae]
MDWNEYLQMQEEDEEHMKAPEQKRKALAEVKSYLAMRAIRIVIPILETYLQG